MKTRFAILATLAALPLAGVLWAQASRGSAVATVGGKKVAVDYGRPALKGRTIDALLKQLPPERIWRAGDSEVTTFSTEGDVQVSGTPVKAGKYSLYVYAPESGRWALVLNSDLGQPLGDIWKEAPENLKKAPYPYLGNYDEKIRAKEVARVELQHAQAAAPAESFTISFAPKGAGSTMTLAWGDQSWSTDVTPVK
jgi:Protein of unknown function (DUF2911)